MQDSRELDGLFRAAFLDRGLVTFAECVEHYGLFSADELLDEMRLLLSAPMLAIPFAVSSARYHALFAALVRCTGCDGIPSEPERAKLVGICIDIGTFLRARAAEGRTGAFELASGYALSAVRRSHLHTGVADQIERGLLASLSEAPEPETTTPGVVDEIQALDFSEPPPALPFLLSA